MTNQSRQPKGVPTGGRFAEHGHSEVDISLSDPSGDDRLLSVVCAEARMAGLRHQRSLAASPEPERLSFLASISRKATVLVQHRDGAVEAFEGRLHTKEDGSVGIRPTRQPAGSIPLTRADGYAQYEILDVAQGTGLSAALTAKYEESAGRVPQLTNPQFDHIPVASEIGDPPSEISAVYVLDHPGFESDQDGRGVVFFATDRDPEGGIVNGYMVVPSGSGMYSEHGSLYEADISRTGGMVAGYVPGSHTFRDAMEFGDKSNDGDIEACWDAVAEAAR